MTIPWVVQAEDFFQSAPGPEAPRPAHRFVSPPREAAPVAPAPVPPTPAPVKADRTDSTHAPSGAVAKVSGEHWIDANCAARSVDIKIVEAPGSGTTMIRDETIPIPAHPRFGTTPPACVGREMPGKSIYYQSNPGFHGADRLGYLVSVGGGEWRRIEVQVSVE